MVFGLGSRRKQASWVNQGGAARDILVLWRPGRILVLLAQASKRLASINTYLADCYLLLSVPLNNSRMTSSSQDIQKHRLLLPKPVLPPSNLPRYRNPEARSICSKRAIIRAETQGPVYFIRCIPPAATERQDYCCSRDIGRRDALNSTILDLLYPERARHPSPYI